VWQPSVTASLRAGRRAILRASAEPGGDFRFDFTGLPGQAYTIHATGDLARPAVEWQTTTSGVFSAGHAPQDHREPAAGPRRFYRLSIP
jgi:hypothetical protein